MSQSDCTIDLESQSIVEKGGGGLNTNVILNNKQNVFNVSFKDMSICLESNSVLAKAVSAPNELSEECGNVVSASVTSTVTTGSNNNNNPQPVIHTIPGSSIAASAQENSEKIEQIIPTPSNSKSIAKFIVSTNHPSSIGNVVGGGGGVVSPTAATVLQKVVNPSLITVLNPTGPLTVVKTLCVTSGITSAPQFTLVNSTPLNVTNSIGKSQTITLLNTTPVTLVKPLPISQNAEKGNNASDLISNCSTNTLQISNTNNSTPTVLPQGAIVNTVTTSTIVENRGHNVFVKNTCPDSTVPDMPQSHKLLTANNFPPTNIITNITPVSTKTVNGQRNKLKILSNVIMPGTSQTATVAAAASTGGVGGNGNNTTIGVGVTTTNILLNKSNNVVGQHQQRFVPRQKVFGPNGTSNTTTKYLNKPNNPNNLLKTNVALKQVQDNKSPTRVVYPTNKSQIKTISSINNYVPPPKGPMGMQQQGIKTLPPQQLQQQKSGPGGKIQRSNTGLRTIPPQRAQKVATAKPNYIGKHAVQAQKVRHPHGKMKSVKMAPSNIPYNYQSIAITEKQLTFNQALTAEIIETLSNKSGSNNHSSNSYPSKHYEILPTRYDNYYQENKQPLIENKQHPQQNEEKTKSGLDALSLICQAVLLDHNYNATLPPDSPRPSLTPISQAQVNGLSSNTMYSPGSAGSGGLISSGNSGPVKRRSLPSTTTMSSTSSLSSLSVAPPNNNSLMSTQDDDAASDISDMSERKHDTEGEETDTAPEAEFVNNEDPFDHYGDYVTRCICGFLHDDGYMVECDQCKVWQHVQCVVKNKQVPDEYLCEVCDPSKPIDRLKARIIQQQWLRDRQFNDPKFSKGAKVKEGFNKQHKEHVSDSDSSDAEQPIHNNNVITKGRNLNSRRKSDAIQKHNNTRQRRDSAKEQQQQQQQQQQQHIQRRQKRRERKVVKRKTKTPQIKSHSEDENQDTWASRLPQLHQWIEKYEEAVTNHYSPELRARISAIRVNGAHSDLSVQYDASVNKCRVHTQPLTEIKYLVTTTQLPPNTPVVELRGKYMLSTQHRNSGGSLTTRQHSQRPGPFLFFYRLHKDNTEVCVDTRTYGNSARFIRRSCKPNAELRHCIEKGVLHLYIVSIAAVEKNAELTLKHESHDLAAIGTTQIACACGNSEECSVNKTTIKKNGETPPEVVHRKRRGRRTTSVTIPQESEQPLPPVKIKEELPVVTSQPSPDLDPIKLEKEEIKEELIIPEEKIKIEVEEDNTSNIPTTKEKRKEIKSEDYNTDEQSSEETKPLKENEDKSPPPTPVTTRRSSQYKSEKEDIKDSSSRDSTTSTQAESKEEKSKSKKLNREERKLAAILRAIEQMEKAESRKQEHQAKQAHRRESEPGPTPKEEDKSEPKMKRRRRKGRARTTSTNTSQISRRNRLNSTDSTMTSGDENLLSPTSDNAPLNRTSLSDLINRNNTRSNSNLSAMDVGESGEQNDKAVGLLLALSNGNDNCSNKNDKSPPREIDSNSNSAQSSPETQLSSACLLVQAAVEPLETGFKFPKKILMNEWLNKVPEPVQSASSISPASLTPHITNNNSNNNTPIVSPGDYEMSGNSSGGCGGGYDSSPAKNLAALAQAASFCDNANVQPRGNAKKRWLRQAISEDHCDSPGNRPESPPISEMVAPPKKRRLPRESLSNEASPPTTPTSVAPPTIPCHLEKSDNDSVLQDGCVEIVYSGAEVDDDNNSCQIMESDAILKERAERMKQEYNVSVAPPVVPPAPLKPVSSLGCLMDPRLMRDHTFNNCEHLVGTVEKTLSLLGFEERRPEAITPAKRKVRLSITEYRQRKKLNNNDKTEEPEPEPTSTEENNSSESFKVTRPRSGSTSSSTSLTSSDDDDISPLEITTKAPAFNSEPTELERQREISSLRLKKAFGLPIDDQCKKPALDVKAILNCEIEPKVKPIALPSPTFPIPGSCEIIRHSPTISVCQVGKLSSGVLAEQQQQMIVETVPLLPSETQEQSDNISVVEETVTENVVVFNNNKLTEDEIVLTPQPVESCKDNDTDDVKSNMFYTPDEEEHAETVFEETESISYVPPFNNPVYPNSSYTPYTSAIDDDARYEGRNPSPPPNMDDAATTNFSDDQAT